MCQVASSHGWVLRHSGPATGHWSSARTSVPLLSLTLRPCLQRLRYDTFAARNVDAVTPTDSVRDSAYAGRWAEDRDLHYASACVSRADPIRLARYPSGLQRSANYR